MIARLLEGAKDCICSVVPNICKLYESTVLLCTPRISSLLPSLHAARGSVVGRIVHRDASSDGATCAHRVVVPAPRPAGPLRGFPLAECRRCLCVRGARVRARVQTSQARIESRGGAGLFAFARRRPETTTRIFGPRVTCRSSSSDADEIDDINDDDQIERVLLTHIHFSPRQESLTRTNITAPRVCPGRSA